MSVLDDIYNGLLGRGFTTPQAQGITAGIYAESGGNPSAVNPYSGAFGIGQWLGSRKTNLVNTYGPTPSLSQQLDYLTNELRGGDAGGKFVLSAANPEGVLGAYITKFMRPAPGAETTGDLARGKSFLSTNFSGTNLGSGMGAGRQALINLLGPEAANWLSDGLVTTGGVLQAPGKAVSGAVDTAKNALDLNGWFTRGAILIFALIFIAAAVFAFKGGDIIQLAKAGA